MDPEVKAQPVRLLDVFVIGPLMIWGGYALRDAGHHNVGPALSGLGLATILYNAFNHEAVRRRHARPT